MKTLKTILIVLVVLIAVTFISTLFMPENKVISRSIEIEAPVETVFNQTNDLKNWKAWSPWHKMDTLQVVKYSENTVGEGAWQTWKSEKRSVGEGKMTILESVANEKIRMGLSFKDWDSSESVYLFETVGEKTKMTITMAMESGNNPIKKLTTFVFSGMLSKQFDDALAGIKVVAENAPEPVAEYKFGEPFETTSGNQFYLSVIDTCNIDVLSEKLGELYGNIMREAAAQNLEQAGSVFAIYHDWNPETGITVLEAAIPVNKMGKSKNDILAKAIVDSKVVTLDFFGPYQLSGKGHEYLIKWMETNNKKIRNSPYEIYINDPTTANSPLEIQTRITYPIE
jgi:effector-binding domain-containing protein/uncharacterized protein YndB with AHSA1/START domain